MSVAHHAKAFGRRRRLIFVQTTDSSGTGFSSGMGLFKGPQTVQGKVGEKHDEGSPYLDHEIIGADEAHTGIDAVASSAFRLQSQ